MQRSCRALLVTDEENKEYGCITKNLIGETQTELYEHYYYLLTEHTVDNVIAH